MIVVDALLLSSLVLPSEFTDEAERLLDLEPDWVVPGIWRSHMHQILAYYLRQKQISIDRALKIQSELENLLKGKEYAVSSLDILTMADQSSISPNKCEYPALAGSFNITLVTLEAELAHEFSDVAIHLLDYLAI